MSESLLVLEINTLMFMRQYFPFDTTDKSIKKNQIAFEQARWSLTEEKKYPDEVRFLRPYFKEFMETAFKVFDNVAIWTQLTFLDLQRFLKLTSIPKEKFLFIKTWPLSPRRGNKAKNLKDIKSEFPQINPSKAILLDNIKQIERLNPHQIVIPSFIMIENDDTLKILQKSFQQLDWDKNLKPQLKQIKSSLPKKQRFSNPKKIERKFDKDAKKEIDVVVNLRIFFHPKLIKEFIPIIRPFSFEFISGLKKIFNKVVFVDWNDKRRRLLKIPKNQVFLPLKKPFSFEKQKPDNVLNFISADGDNYSPFDFHTEPNTFYIHPFYKSDDDLLKILLARLNKVQWKSLKDTDKEVQKINKDTLHFRDLSKTQEFC